MADSLWYILKWHLPLVISPLAISPSQFSPYCTKISFMTRGVLGSSTPNAGLGPGADVHNKSLFYIVFCPPTSPSRSVCRSVRRSVGRSVTLYWYHNILEGFKAFSIILWLNSHSYHILLKVDFCWPWIKVKVTVKVRLNWHVSAMSPDKLKLEAVKRMHVSIMPRPRLSLKMGDLGLFSRSLWKKAENWIFWMFMKEVTLRSL